jgi:hypothetical protein
MLFRACVAEGGIGSVPGTSEPLHVTKQEPGPRKFLIKVLKDVREKVRLSNTEQR